MRGWIVRLLLTAFVLRALVPVGYMPDFSTSAKGVFKVVICSTTGAKTVTLDDNGKPISDETSEHHGEPCAFSGLAAVALAEPIANSLLAPDFSVSPALPRLAVTLPPARAGPQLGSRGPPQLS